MKWPWGRKAWAAGLAAVLVAGGVAVASNMGFKLVYPLFHSGGLPANDFEVSIPFNTPFVNAHSIYQGLVGGVQQVAKLDPATNTFTLWFPSPGNAANNFPVAKGEGYIVRVPFGATSTLTLVGSHDPAFTYNFNIAGRDFITSVPYHTTWNTANDMFQAIGPNAAQVTRLDPATNTFTIWFPSPGGAANNFPITIGEGYRVRVTAAPTVVVPEHF